MRKTPRKTGAVRAVAAMVAVVAVAMIAVSPVRADTKSELRAAEARLDKLLSKIEAESKTAQALQSEANVLAGKISDVEDHLAATAGKIAQTQQDLRLAAEDLQAAQDQLDQRARIAYENGPGSNLEFLLGATSLADLNDRLQIINRVAQSDQDLINAIAEKQNQLHIRQVGLQALQDKLARQNREYKAQQSLLEQKLSQAQQILDQLRHDRADAGRQVKRLKDKRAAEIRAARLAAARLLASASHSGPAIGGVFQVCPVDQPRAYSDSFGAPRYAGGYHPHAGNDIMAPMGTPIRAPFAGNAVVASNGLGGLSVKVYGAGGWVYNAHLSSLGTLGAVSAGTMVGRVGNSGDARGGATHDHFEWHPYRVPSNLWKSPYGYTIIGDAIDPYPYLNAVC